MLSNCQRYETDAQKRKLNANAKKFRSRQKKTVKLEWWCRMIVFMIISERNLNSRIIAKHNFPFTFHLFERIQRIKRSCRDWPDTTLFVEDVRFATLTSTRVIVHFVFSYVSTVFFLISCPIIVVGIYAQETETFRIRIFTRILEFLSFHVSCLLEYDIEVKGKY